MILSNIVIREAFHVISLNTGRIYIVCGRAVAQAVSRWLPTAAARVRVRAACGVCGGQSGTGAGLLLVLRFPLPIHQFLHHHNHPGLAQ
jgi:hypothetical protein